MAAIIISRSNPKTRDSVVIKPTTSVDFSNFCCIIRSVVEDKNNGGKLFYPYMKFLQ